MFLNRQDIEKIQGILDQFPDVEHFEIKQDTSSGIGSITTMTFGHKTNGVNGSFIVEVTGIESW